ncbi:protein croquemort-like isoform X1 [Zerene cesonia]|uniref:protein croquemort-like isoform X1 n=1 Tax=Zerene cesonia TaxID=33412 RepID=UPI0018E5A6CB|nr:protein croquemort-like isoform X1 [Zerene cesonia]
MVVSRNIAWFICSGVALVIIGGVLNVIWPELFFAQIQRMMILANGSTSFYIWRDIPIPMYLECFLFNITNVDDILSGKNVTISVQQMGPYVFREIRKKVNITWNDNSTVTFKNQRFWHYHPEMSNGSLSDMVTSINPIVVTIAYALRNERVMLRVFVDMVMRMVHTNMFMTANVSSWLFDGVEDPLLNLATRIPNLPYSIPFDRFGWLYTRNGSAEFDGVFVSNTGASDFFNLGLIEKWQHTKRTVYRGKCGDLEGSSGELWAPQRGLNELHIFAPDICTHMTLTADGPVTHQGIEGMQYIANDSLFDNGFRYPEMSCYCDEPRDRNCIRGALNVSACRFGAPAFVTRPHFLDMDPYYPNKIAGLGPEKKQNFKMAIELNTGMPLSISAQLQANALVRHIPGMSLNNQLPDPDVLVPMFWFREEILVSEEYANFAKTALSVKFDSPYAFYTLIVIGCCLIIAGIWRYRQNRCISKENHIYDAAAMQSFLTNILEK